MTREEILAEHRTNLINRLIEIVRTISDSSVEDGILLSNLLEEKEYVEEELERNRKRLARLISNS